MHVTASTSDDRGGDQKEGSSRLRPAVLVSAHVASVGSV